MGDGTELSQFKPVFTLSVLNDYLAEAGYPDQMFIPLPFFLKLIFLISSMASDVARGMSHRLSRDDEGEFIVVGRTVIRPKYPPGPAQKLVDFTDRMASECIL